jgi:hypothetical protein
MVRFAAGPGRELVYLTLDRTAHILSSEDVKLLCECGEFRALEEHARLSGNSRREQARVGEALRRLVRSRTLMSYGDFMTRAGSEPLVAISPRHIGWVVIPTCDRIAELRSALTSYIRNFKRYGHSVRILVADDSRFGRFNDIEQLLRVCTARTGIEVFYCGVEEKRAFERLLINNGDLPKEVTSFALFGEGFFGPTIGANRNATLLHTLDELVLSVDDDTQGRVGQFGDPSGQTALALSAQPSVTELWSFPNRNAAMETIDFTDADILGEHEQFIGQSVAAIIGSATRRGFLNVCEASDDMLRALCVEGGRVAVTFDGIVGDTGLHSPWWLFLYARDIMKTRLSEMLYRQAFSSREAVRQARYPTIGIAGEWIGTVMAIDNQSGTPPFMPVFRSEDYVFGRTLALCFKGSYFGYLPRVVTHLPAKPRHYDLNPFSETRPSDVILALMAMWTGNTRQSEPDDQLRSLGRYLGDTGRLPPAAFKEAINVALRPRALELIARLIRYIDCPDMPEVAVSDAKRHIESLSNHLRYSQMSSIPERTDIPDGSCLDGRVSSLQDFVRKFGDLLLWWPAIINRARSLRKAEHQVGKQI